MLHSINIFNHKDHHLDYHLGIKVRQVGTLDHMVVGSFRFTCGVQKQWTIGRKGIDIGELFEDCLQFHGVCGNMGTSPRAFFNA